MRKFLLLGVILISAFLCAENARLNVVTDLPGAKVYIDGVMAGETAIQNYELEPGEHYVMVEYRNKKIFAKTYNLGDGEVKTIPTAHFVDFKTNVANRGAVDVEAARIRETRGNFGIGIQAMSTMGGISIKKWFTDRFGIQGFAFINNESEGIKYQSQGRLLIWLADKVAFNAPFSGYIFFGGGSDKYMNSDNSEKNISRGVTNGGFGIEFSIFGVNGMFLNLELGSEKRDIVYSDPEKKNKTEAQMIGGAGLHFYF
jgi:hypothetical protein